LIIDAELSLRFCIVKFHFIITDVVSDDAAFDDNAKILLLDRLSSNAVSYGLKVDLDIYIQPLTLKPKQHQFRPTIQSGILINTSSRQCGAIGRQLPMAQTNALWIHRPQ